MDSTRLTLFRELGSAIDSSVRHGCEAIERTLDRMLVSRQLTQVVGTGNGA